MESNAYDKRSNDAMDRYGEAQSASLDNGALIGEIGAPIWDHKPA
jgi:hypothetical protein